MSAAGREPWRVEWTAEALHSLKRVPPRIIDAAFAFADTRLTENPLRNTHRLDPPLHPKRSGSVGPYRVLVEVDQQDNIVWVVKVAYHTDVYRPY
jgi:mRNA-degrading endonuclease RelE of RelBE toxin-antitoxin system